MQPEISLRLLIQSKKIDFNKILCFKLGHKEKSPILAKHIRVIYFRYLFVNLVYILVIHREINGKFLKKNSKTG